MKNRLINICIFLTVLIFFGCSVIKKNETIANRQENIDVDVLTDSESQGNNDHISDIVIDTYEIVHNNITDFFFVEIMNGNKGLDFHRDKYGVKDIFGEPLDINVRKVSFNFVGGRVIEIHELIYDDFTHIYYIFESGTIFYEGFIIEKKLERLKTINIGDTSNKLLLTFSDKYYTWEEYENIKENISYYTDPVTCEIQFVIKDTIIQKIFVNFLLI
jgi:hypothetical protein